MATLLDGKAAAAALEQEVAAAAGRFAERAGRQPGLVVVLVGDDPASAVYVRNKTGAAGRVGIRSETRRLSPEVATDDLLDLVGSLNADETVDGVLVQLPLPPGVDARAVVQAVAPAKDVDGFHPVNLGRLVQGREGLVPCTPSGILALLLRHGIPLEGARAAVVGRSVIVGKPMALLLLNRNATVTLCHSRTRDLPSVTREADILVSAVGRPGLIRSGHVKPGATVVDVGMNRITDRDLAERLWGGTPRFETFLRKGALLVGDVDYRDVEPVAGAITPVPGGVGPMTVVQLLRNTVEAAEARTRLSGPS